MRSQTSAFFVTIKPILIIFKELERIKKSSKHTTQHKLQQ
jgi:hypothetical protein